MDVKKRCINGDECELAVYGEKYTRFFVEGNYYSVPTGIEKDVKEKELRIAVNFNDDGSTSLCSQKMIPWDTEYENLKSLFEEQLNQIEKELGLKTRLPSSGWNIGHDSTEFDNLMTEEEQKMIAQ